MFLLYYTMSCLYLFTYKIEYDVIIQKDENVNCHTGVQCIPTHVHYCIMELKSSSCGYQLINCVAD